MIDAECQQLHNGDYRFDGGINGGNNGVFGFSGDWGYFWGFSLDFLSWASCSTKGGQAFAGGLSGLFGCNRELLPWAISGIFSVRANARVV
ncbi:hypothetical protein [Polynucleobacter sp. MWH-Svant-W18]|uniref:hypothetical protein n=1 Tax=Polynucleobacter sp. MWH-Svant-W18 TaxID=1855909 RepID=UPI001BFED112|nr:hypothetical protein [Polynucleobacter sp. MWH-Svant-W18]QWD78114.1 hypothetical protein C2757_00725 [Polynucleobacter sp. MWH-Svant-W18]